MEGVAHLYRDHGTFCLFSRENNHLLPTYCFKVPKNDIMGAVAKSWADSTKPLLTKVKSFKLH